MTREVMIDGVKYVPDRPSKVVRKETPYELAERLHDKIWNDLKELEWNQRSQLLAMSYRLRNILQGDC